MATYFIQFDYIVKINLFVSHSLNKITFQKFKSSFSSFYKMETFIKIKTAELYFLLFINYYVLNFLLFFWNVMGSFFKFYL